MKAQSFTGRQWRAPEFAGLFESPEKLQQTLAQARGLQDVLERKKLSLSSPSLFVEMGRAVERILDAVMHREKIVIFGDYDADGITASALLARFFRSCDAEYSVMLPHRIQHGYGLKDEFMDTWKNLGVSLIITVDTGIVAHDAIKKAEDLGMNVIVTDHHTPLHGRPPAHSVIHPSIPSAFPNQHLSGAGVAFMLVQALREHLAGGVEVSGWPGVEEDLLLATIGTIADVMPLTGENRTLVQAGLSCIRHIKPESPLRRLLSGAGNDMTSRDVSHLLAPLLNAAGRIADPSLGLDAILHGGDATDKLLTLNEERRALTIDGMEKIRTLVTSDDAFLCVMHENFHPGIIGLLAGGLTRDFGKPSFVASLRNGIGTASMRSIEGVDLSEFLLDEELRSMFLTVGGHAYAAGCTFHGEDFEKIRARFNGLSQKRSVEVPKTPVTAELSLKCLDQNVSDALTSLEPFGRSNEEPTFLLSSVTVSNPKTISDGRHLQCGVNGLRAVGFGLGDAVKLCEAPVDILCHIRKNVWNGQTRSQLYITDVRPAA